MPRGRTRAFAGHGCASCAIQLWAVDIKAGESRCDDAAKGYLCRNQGAPSSYQSPQPYQQPQDYSSPSSADTSLGGGDQSPPAQSHLTHCIGTH